MKTNNNNNNNKKLAFKSKTLTAIKPEQTKHEADNVSVPPKPNKSKSSIIVTCGKRAGISTNNNSSTSKLISEGSNKKSIDGTKKERVEEKGIKSNTESKKNNGSSDFVAVEDKGVRKKRSQERVGVGHGRRGLRNGSSGSTTNNSGGESSEREFGGNELSSHDAAVKTTEVVKKESVKKKLGAARFLKRMKQTSPKDVEHDKENVSEKEDSEVEKEEEEDNDDNDDEEEEEDRSEVKKEEEDEKKRKAKKANKPLASSVSGSKDQKRVTRNAAAKGRAAEESSRKGKRGVGRPPKRPEKATANGKKAGRGSNADHQREAGVGSVGRLKKRSRR